VWLFVAHGKQTRMQNHEAELVQAAEAIGLQIDRVHAIGVAAGCAQNLWHHPEDRVPRTAKSSVP